MSQKNNQPGPLEILIRGGLVFNGSGSLPEVKNIGINKGKVAYIGPNSPKANLVITAEGLFVSPGFIDTHSHSDFNLVADPLSAEGKLFQGVTTEINGNCGLSGGPLLNAAKAQRENDLKALSIPERWESMGEYLKIVEDRGLYYNFVTLVGHGNLRAGAMGYANRRPSQTEMTDMEKLLEDGLSAGAIGMSTGLIYPPGAYSDTDELRTLAARGRKSFENFIYASHMRSEADGLLEAIDECIQIGKAAGRAQVSHIKTSGERNWNKIEAAIRKIEEARADGLAISADRYPYTAGATDLDAVLPSWMYEGGNRAEMERLGDRSVVEKLKTEVDRGRTNWEKIYISDTSCPVDKWAEGKSIAEIAGKWGVSPFDAVIRLLLNARLAVGAIFHGMSEDNLKRFYGLPWVMVGSDSSARAFSGITASGKPHPRTFGTFPRFLKIYTANKDQQALSEAIRKITDLPARTFGLEKRGRIEEGFNADLVIFDLEKLQDNATYETPIRKAGGIIHLFINGEAVLKEGVLTAKTPGKILRNGV